jgi:hypothetical protein
MSLRTRVHGVTVWTLCAFKTWEFVMTINPSLVPSLPPILLTHLSCCLLAPVLRLSDSSSVRSSGWCTGPPGWRTFQFETTPTQSCCGRPWLPPTCVRTHLSDVTSFVHTILYVFYALNLTLKVHYVMWHLSVATSCQLIHRIIVAHSTACPHTCQSSSGEWRQIFVR